ncbi:MAG: hypothetical protein JW822_14195 [Spirochaetales bacterium]|nr:hypothetical protein [Spirochaetales bacterium]
MEQKAKINIVITIIALVIFIGNAILWTAKEDFLFAIPFIILSAAVVISSYPVHKLLKLDFNNKANPLRIIAFILTVAAAGLFVMNIMHLF